MTEEEKISPRQMGFMPTLSTGRLIFLGLASVFLSFVGPLSIFAPVPLAMAALLYGRVRSGALAGGLFIFLLILASRPFFSLYAAGAFFIACIFAAAVAEIVLRGIGPVRGLFRAGALILLAILALLGIYTLFTDSGLEKELQVSLAKQFSLFQEQNKEFLKIGGEDARVLQDFLKHPEKVVQAIFHWSPSILVISTFGGLWISLGIVLRNAPLWRSRVNYGYGIRELLEFRVPEVFVWPLILGLVLAVGGSYLSPGLTILGGNMLYCLGVFYFFQGFGILSAFLTHLKVFGIFRTMLIVFTVVAAMKVLVFVGVFDMWLNFRKFFVKKEEQ